MSGEPSSSKRPLVDAEDREKNKAPRLDLYSRLDQSSFADYDNQKLQEFLGEKGLNDLATSSSKMDGVDFLVNLAELDQKHPSEMQKLAELAGTEPALQPNLVIQKRTFSANTTLLSNSGHFYVKRRFQLDLSRKIKGPGGFILVHGPRSSGKSTLMLQSIENLPSDRFVYGLLEISPNLSGQDMWKEMMTRLARDTSVASPKVRAVARNFLDPSTQTSANPMMHLFDAEYGDKIKAVFFWDEFDNAYEPSRKKEVSNALRSVENEVTRNSMPSFQAMVFFGSYNANLLTSETGSTFVVPPENTFSHENLDFTPSETKELFRQYQQEYSVQVADEVVTNIHEMTGGHTGLTNLCGYFIQRRQKEEGSDFDLASWQNAFSGLVQWISKRPTFEAIMQALKTVKEPGDTLELLRRLCYGEGDADDNSQACKNLQQLGLANTREVDGKTLLVIKSDLIRRFSLLHLVRDEPAFTNVPMVAEQNLVDIPELLKAAVRHFVPAIILAAKDNASKKIYNSNRRGPRESVYQTQFYAVLLRALEPLFSWKFHFEAGESNSKLDFHLYQHHEGGLHVGIEFTASEGPTQFGIHAARDYPQSLKLDQYVLVNFTPDKPNKGFDQEGWYSKEGCDRDGQKCQIPIYHVLHNEAFSKVELYCKLPGDAQETVVSILGS